MKPLSQPLQYSCGIAATRHRTEVIAVIGSKGAVLCAAERMGFLKDCVEYRGKITGRSIDDLQDFGGRRLLLKSLARFRNEPGVLHSDNCLRRKVLDQRDLPF